MLASAWSDTWITVGQIAVLMLCGAGVLFLQKVKQWAYDWWKSRRLHPLARSIFANRKVHTLLVELRTKVDSDRAYIFLFHNGQVFSNLNPVWRLSCTQESCRMGITYEIERLQNILASTVWDCLAPLLGQEGQVDGVKTFTRNGKKMFVFDTEMLADGFMKRSLHARGVKSQLITPLFDSKKQTVGFLGIDFCADDPDMDKNEVVERMTSAAGDIYYALME